MTCPWRTCATPTRARSRTSHWPFSSCGWSGCTTTPICALPSGRSHRPRRGGKERSRHTTTRPTCHQRALECRRTRGWLRSVHLPDGRTIAYQNDSLGRRTAKLVGGQVQARWLYVDGLRLLAELNAGEQLVSRFVYAERGNVPSAMVK